MLLEAALPMLYSSINYHQEHATEIRRLNKDIVTTCGAGILRRSFQTV